MMNGGQRGRGAGNASSVANGSKYLKYFVTSECDNQMCD